MNDKAMESKIKEIEEAYRSGKTYKTLSEIYNIPERTLKYWRRKYGWSREKKEEVRKPRGAPKENKNNLKHGLYSKYMQKEFNDLLQDINRSTSLDIMWANIEVLCARIAQAQQLMHVKDKDDLTKELKKKKTSDKGTEVEYEIQFAWDKQEKFLVALSRAMDTLTKMIKAYEEQLHKNWELATEEQRTRIEVLKGKLVNQDVSHEKGITINIDIPRKENKDD